MKKYFTLILIVSALQAWAQAPSLSDSSELYNLDLDQLVNLKSTGSSSELEGLVNASTGMASGRKLSARKTPGIVSIIDQEQIRMAGARDMIDVLRLVPGFEFGVDVQGVVGLGLRGNWAQEGKILILLDGLEMNEIFYGTGQFGMHFDVNQIKRIEIIRGPGSAIYGGYAAYGVINIITFDGQELKGARTNLTYGRFDSHTARISGSAVVGNNFKNGKWSIGTFAGKASRSAGTYTDIDGQSIGLDAQNSKIQPAMINAAFSLSNLSARIIADRYHTTNVTNTGLINPTMPNNFGSVIGELKYVAHLSPFWTITPRISYKWQRPWQSPPLVEGDYPYDKTGSRTRINMIGAYEANKAISAIIGAEYFQDDARSNIDSVLFYNQQTKIRYQNMSLFGEFLYKSKVANLIAGARYEQNNAYGSAFVPRFGVTKKAGALSFKALYSYSFRAPAIENVNLAFGTEKLKPEKNRVLELETAWQPNKNWYFTLNFYDIKSTQVIVYFYDQEQNLDGYKNSSRTGSRGVEYEMKWMNKSGFVNFNYAFYTNQNMNQVQAYAVEDNSAVKLGFAPHKLNLIAGLSLSKTWKISGTCSYFSQRYSLVYDPEFISEGQIKPLDPAAVIGVFLHYKPKQLPLDFSVGMHDISASGYGYVQPFNSGHTPLPAPGRELIIKLNWSPKF